MRLRICRPAPPGLRAALAASALAIFASNGALASETALVLTDLSNDNPRLSELRADIAANLRSTARSGDLARPLRFYQYRVKPGENFFQIVARVSQDPDTLASLNRVIHPNAIGAGETLLIPNARGVFIEGGDRARVAGRYNMKPDELQAHGERWFLPGRRFTELELEYFRGDGFASPLPSARVSSGFGMRTDPFTRRRTFHGGVDLAAPAGTPALASRAGRVVRAQYVRGYGNLVVIEHDLNYQTYYGHLSQIKVRVGQRVETGETVGLVGATGRATGPHLHFEVRRNGVRTAPRFVHGERFADGEE